MFLITEHYHAMELLACSQTLPSTDYPTYKIHCMLGSDHLVYRVQGHALCAASHISVWSA